MLWALIKNSIFKNKIQKSLAFLSCFLATLLLCAMLNITLGIGNEVGKQLRSYGSNIIILPKGSNLAIEVGNQIYEPLKNKAYLEESQLHKIKEIFWRNNITAFAPFLDGKVKMNGKEVLIVGTYFDKSIKIADEEGFSTGIQSLYPLLQVSGEWLKDDSLEEVMIGDEFASKNSLKIGDELDLNGRKVKIIGILHHAGKNAHKIIASLHLVQNLLDKKGLFSMAEVSALTIPEDDLSQKARRDNSSLSSLEYDTWYCSAYVGSIALQIEEDFKGASAKAQTAISDAQSLIINKIQSLMVGTAIICLIVASIAIASLMSSEIHRRKKQIGLLKVLGANTFQIYVIFASENLLVALVAALFGFGFGVGLSQIIALSIFDYTIATSFIALPLCLAFAALTVLLGCLFALKDILNLLPVQVLYGK